MEEKVWGQQWDLLIQKRGGGGLVQNGSNGRGEHGGFRIHSEGGAGGIYRLDLIRKMSEVKDDPEPSGLRNLWNGVAIY